jgi:hypothetical protein
VCALSKNEEGEGRGERRELVWGWISERGDPTFAIYLQIQRMLYFLPHTSLSFSFSFSFSIFSNLDTTFVVVKFSNHTIVSACDFYGSFVTLYLAKWVKFFDYISHFHMPGGN